MATILVVDDRAANRDYLVLLLGHVGHRVLAAGDGLAALDMALAERPDLVITDILMPTLDGAELVRRMRQHPDLATVPVVFYTATFRTQEGQRIARACGVEHVITKPAEPEEVLAIVAMVLGEDCSAVVPQGLPTPRAGLPGGPWGRRMQGLEELHERLAALAELGLRVAQEGELSQLGVQLHASADDLRGMHLRLAAAVEIGFDLAGEQDPEPLLERFLYGAHQLLASRCVGLGLLAEGGGRAERVLTRGGSPAGTVALPPPPIDGVWLEVALGEAGARLSTAQLAAGVLPVGHPVVADLLAVPLAGRRGLLGWLYAADPLGRPAFTPDDRDLARLLAAELAVAYENVRLCEALRDHAAALAGEVEERRRLEILARRDEQRYRLLFDQHPLAMWVLDPATRCLLAVNDAAVAQYGYSRAELLALRLEDLAPDEDLAELVSHFDVTGSAHGESPRTGRVWRQRRRNGEELLVELVAMRVDLDGEAARLVVAQDVTEKRQLERQLVQAQRLEALGRLAGGVAHDFNNLLTVLIGLAELSLPRASGDERLRGFLDLSLTTCQRAADLTRQLLAFGRRQVLDPKVLLLDQLVGGLEAMLGRLIGEDIELRFLLASRLPVRADAGQLEQVVVNLAVNARDAMPTGGSLLIETRDVELDADYVAEHPEASVGPHVLLAVSDTGTGMSPSVLAQIFEPFFTTKEMGKGTGLGLSTVYGIVRQSGGHCTAYSELGRGTTLRVHLPAITQAMPSDGPVRPALPVPEGVETVLLVEDDAAVRSVAGEMLRGLGYRVLEAGDGAQAMALARWHAEPIHVFMSDVVMPRVSGPQLALEIVGLRPGIRTLFMSGYTDEAVVHHGLLESGAAFLQKPFSRHALGAKLREVLAAPG